MLLAALCDVDWDMFQCTSNDVGKFVEATMLDNVVSSVRVKFFPNQKLWVDRYIQATLNAWTTA